MYGETLRTRKLGVTELDEQTRKAAFRVCCDRLAGRCPDRADDLRDNCATANSASDARPGQRGGLRRSPEDQNTGALMTHAAKAQHARFKIACTGTPVENNLADLWCLFDFLQPGLLGALGRSAPRIVDRSKPVPTRAANNSINYAG